MAMPFIFIGWHCSTSPPPLSPIWCAGIEYVLATTDPSGSPTDGIVRHYNTAWFNYNRCVVANA